MIKAQPLQPVEHWINVRQPAMAGLNTFTDVHDIKDQESPDLNNVYFDMGVIGPRTGSSVFLAKPSGEAANALQAMVAKTSDGLEYLVTVYGTNFYLWDTVNNYYVKINHTFVPTVVSYYGWLSWDAGFGKDSLYFCNGKDDCARWRMNINYLAQSQVSGDTTITLKDSTRFYTSTNTITGVSGSVISISNSSGLSTPTGQALYYTSSGSVITGLTNNTVYYAISNNGNNSGTVQLATTLANAKAGTAISLSGAGSGNQFLYFAESIIIFDGVNSAYVTYYLNSANVLTLTGTIGQAFGTGATVVSEITDRPAVQIGKVMTKNQQRLWTANKTGGGEVNIYWSATTDPEDYTGGNNPQNSGFLSLTDGNGGITMLADFGEFIIAGKEDSLNRIAFTLNSSLSADLTQVTPISSGKGMGPISTQSTIKAMNTLYYPTRFSGMLSLAPVNSGYTTTLGINNISYSIFNYLNQKVSFQSDSRAAYFNQKILWTCSTGQTNNIILMYDLLRNAWTRFDNWNPADIFVMGSNFYYLSAIDGKVYQGFTGYTDNSNPYIAYFTTKLNNFGEPAMPKTLDAIYLEGYMTQSTSFFVDVLFNEKGSIITKTYSLNISTKNFYFKTVTIDALGQTPFNQAIFDDLSPSQLQDFGFFRCYLSVPNSYGVYAIQMKIYSTAANSVWFLVGHAANPQLEIIIPPLLRIDSSN